ncbi:MAG: hypothetical protein AAFW46_12300 [Pseudomonadota bacterium]
MPRKRSPRLAASIRIFAAAIVAMAVVAIATLAPGARAAEGGPPVEEFQNSFWRYCEESCGTTVYYHRIHLRADGSMGYQPGAADEMVYDGTDQWKLVGPYLVLVWTNGFAMEVYQVGEGGQERYRGLHSGVDAISVIERAEEG